jgi:hypothetical protein
MLSDLNTDKVRIISALTKKTSLNDLGLFIPSVSRLVLAKSFIPDIRQLGAKYSNLTALFLNDCSLVDLEGIGSISSSLSIVSLQHNRVHDLEPLSGIWNLTTCDLRSNMIRDAEQLEYLKFCQKLENVWISDNPFVESLSIADVTKIEDELIPTPYVSSTEASTESLAISKPPLLPSPPKSQEGRINPRKPRSSRMEGVKKSLVISESTAIIAARATLNPEMPEDLPPLKKSIRLAYRLPIN